MKLYHIDRTQKLNCGILELKKDVSIKMEPKIKDAFKNNLAEYYPNGLSNHGETYYSMQINKCNYINYITDIVFEYERLLNFPNCISRYESFFCF